MKGNEISEKELTSQVRDYLNILEKYGSLIWMRDEISFTPGRIPSKAGMPDFIIFLASRATRGLPKVLLVELKTSKGRLTPCQKATKEFIDNQTAPNVQWHTVRSFEELRTLINNNVIDTSFV